MAFRRLMRSDLALPEGSVETLFPALHGPLIRRPRDADDPASMPGYEALTAIFGMLPHWAEPKLAGRTYNARSETAAGKPTFRNAWAKAQHCLVPMESFYEPDHRGAGRPVRTRFEDVNGEPLCAAGLWEYRHEAVGGQHFSYTMLTVNADDHPLLRNYHAIGHEKRMLVLLARQDWDAWLDASAERSMDFMRQFPAESLTATPDPVPVRPKAPKPERAEPKPGAGAVPAGEASSDLFGAAGQA